MPKRGDDLSAAIAAGALVLGLGLLVGTAISSGSSDKRAAFQARLRERLSQRGISVINAEFGRVENVATWTLTLQLPNQHVLTLHAPVPEGRDAFSQGVSDEIAERVVQHVT